MNKYYCLLLSAYFVHLLQPYQLHAQKKAITMDTYTTWHEQSQLGDYGVTNDGEYIWYNKLDTTYVVSKKGQLKHTIAPGGITYFSVDKSLVYSSESVVKQLNLKTGSIKKYIIKNIHEMELLPSGYQFIINTFDNCIIMFNTRSGSIDTIQSNVQEYKFNQLKSVVLVKNKNGVSWIDIASGSSKNIGKELDVDFSTISFDKSAQKVLFKTKAQSEKAPVWYYYDRLKTDGTPKLVIPHSEMLPEGYDLSTASPSFSADGRRLIIKIYALPAKEEKKAYKDFWHYQGRRYLKWFGNPRQTIIVLSNLGDATPTFKVLAEGSVELRGDAIPQKYILIKKSFMVYDDLYWNEDMRPEFILANLENGETRQIIENDVAPIAPRYPYLSPNEKYITWFDYTQGEYLCYEIATQQTRNLTKGINIPADITEAREGSIPRKIRGLEEWVANDEAIIFSDKYDLWQVDPKGIKLPLNLTGNYGRDHGVVFKPANLQNLQSQTYHPLLSGQPLLLRAMSVITKDNGFYKIKIGQMNKLEDGHLKPCLFSWNIEGEPACIAKAKSADTYLVSRQTAAEAPNLCVTNDLQSFLKLTDFAPQREYNWLTSELVNYPLRNGKTGQAILFKPENFDPSKKYPVIFNYYESRTDGLHKFRHPQIFENNIDVATYVNNGYLVCMPDINNDDPGKVSSTVVDAVESAVDYLSKYSWFDTSKMGLQGQSFGGYETNILVANSKRFKAACSMAGISDAISGYFGNAFGERSATWCYEEGQFNFHTTPWDNLQVYIDNSPVLKANEVVTPLLLLHNRSDNAVPFNHAYEMFYALRRLKKPVWLYEYEGGHTSPGGEESNRDFTIRLQAFFDHYLKGEPAPDWLMPISSKNPW